LATVINKYNLCDLRDTASGAALVPVSSTRYSQLVPNFAQNKPDTYVNDGFGKLAVDTSSHSPYQHRVYLPAMDCGRLNSVQEINRGVASFHQCPGSTEIHVLVSSDRGASWSIKQVARGTSDQIPGLATWVATDTAGNVYLVWWDGHHVYLDVSRDGADHWSAPSRVDQAPSNTSVLATIAGGGRGTIELAWYGTDRSGASNDPSVMGAPGSSTGAAWQVYSARSTDFGQTFTQTVATGVVHRGQVCTGGDSCDDTSGERDLFDDFGLAVSPTTGCSSIAYDSDQPQGDLAHTYVGYASEQSHDNRCGL
jgi:hypothetical protein